MNKCIFFFSDGYIKKIIVLLKCDKFIIKLKFRVVYVSKDVEFVSINVKCKVKILIMFFIFIMIYIICF